MLQLFILLLISWLLIWLFEKKDLSVLGLTPSGERVKFFLILFVISGLCSASAFLLKMVIAKEQYTLDYSLTATSILTETWNQVRMVLTEELICRGALLYILIKRTGMTKAIVISSVIFAVLHWINAGVWGNIVQMTIVFVFTFLMGLLLAYSYARTYSLYIPFSIHFGWNFVQNFVFQDAAVGSHIFRLVAPPSEVTISYFAFFTMLLLPKISILILDFLIVRRHRKVEVVE